MEEIILGLKEYVYYIFNNVITWLSTPNTYFQAILAGLAFLAAQTIGAYVVRRTSLFKKPKFGESYFRFKFYKYRFSKLVTPILLIFFLYVVVLISRYYFGNDLLANALKRAAIVYLIYTFLKAYVRNPLVRAVGYWIVVPAMVLHTFNYFFTAAEYLDEISFQIGEVTITLFRVLFIIVAAIVVVWLLSIGFSQSERIAKREELKNRQSTMLFVKLMEFCVFAIVLLVLLQVLGFSNDTILFMGGIVAVGTVLSSYVIFENIMASISLLFTRSIRVGDFIEVEGSRGVIKRRTPQAVVIENEESQEEHIPNKFMVKNVVKNYSRPSDINKYSFEIDVDVKDKDIKYLPKKIEEVLAKNKSISLRPYKPCCFLKEIKGGRAYLKVEYYASGVEGLHGHRFKNDVMFDVLSLVK